VQQVLHGLGITHSLHKLRHAYGTAMYAASNDLRMVQEVMGHSSPNTTAGYVGYAHGVAHDAADRITAGAGLAAPARPLRVIGKDQAAAG